MSKVKVVAKDQGSIEALNEVFAEQKCLSNPLRLRLFKIVKLTAPLTTVLEQFFKKMLLFRRCNNGYFPDASLHQDCQRVINHRLVINRHQLLADASRQGKQARAGSSGKNNSSPRLHRSLSL